VIYKRPGLGSPARLHEPQDPAPGRGGRITRGHDQSDDARRRIRAYSRGGHPPQPLGAVKAEASSGSTRYVLDVFRNRGTTSANMSDRYTMCRSAGLPRGGPASSSTGQPGEPRRTWYFRVYAGEALRPAGRQACVVVRARSARPRSPAGARITMPSPQGSEAPHVPPGLGSARPSFDAGNRIPIRTAPPALRWTRDQPRTWPRAAPHCPFADADRAVETATSWSATRPTRAGPAVLSIVQDHSCWRPLAIWPTLLPVAGVWVSGLHPSATPSPASPTASTIIGLGDPRDPGP